MESQPQNPEFRNNSDKFHPCIYHPSPLSQIDNDGRIRIRFRIVLGPSLIFCFVLVDSLRLIQQFFSHVESGLPELNQY